MELFNQQKFFEAHEEIEKIWLKEKKNEFGDFYKGIIQAAVALHHLKKGNKSGALRLYQSSTTYLRKYVPHTLGIDVEKLVHDLDHFWGRVSDKRNLSLCDFVDLIPKIRWVIKKKPVKKGTSSKRT